MALRPVETTLVIALMCCWTHAGNPSSNPPECPPWYYTSSEDKCLFSETLSGVVNRFGNTSEIQIGFCIDQYHNNSTLVVVQCQYNPAPAGNNHNPGNYTTIYQILPEHVDQLNEAVCGPLNRRGYLCSECKENYGLAAYRYYGLLCVECTHTLWKSVAYTILLLLTTTASFLTFLLFNINVHSGNLTGFILFSHTIISNVSFFPSLISLSQPLFGYWPIHILFSLYGVWSLNSLQFLIPPFCVSPHLTTLQLISLGYIPSLYVLLLCAVIFYLIEAHDKGNRTLIKAWKPFQRFLVKFKRPSNARFSVIYTFGTLVLLSYEKNLFITFTLLQGFVPVQLETTTNTLRTLPPTLSVDLQAPYLGSGHVPYFVLGVVGGLLTVLLPLVLVLIFPTRVFPKLVHCCGLRRWHGVRTFMEVFTGTYKDGTDPRFGKTDYRFTAAVSLLARVLVGIACSFRSSVNTMFRHTSWLFAIVPYTIAAVCFAFFKPHRKERHNALDTLLLLLLAKISTCLYFIFDANIGESTFKFIVLLLLIDLAVPQVVLVTYFGYKLLSWLCAQDMKGLVNVVRSNTRHERENINREEVTHERERDSQPLLVK